jgi:hypothetical protein
MTLPAHSLILVRPLGVQSRLQPADALGMIRRLLRIPRAHRSVPVKTLRRWKLA